MNSKIIAGIAGGVAVVAMLAYLASVQTIPGPQTQVANSGGLQAAQVCTKGDFRADPSQDDVEITMNAYQWKYSYCSITIYQGQTVTLTLQSVDVPHGFAIDGYPEVGSTHISPSAQSVVKFTADKVGQFTYYCTVFCGEGHPLHKGQLVVKSR